MEYHVGVLYWGGESFCGEISASSAHDACRWVMSQMCKSLANEYINSGARQLQIELRGAAARRLDLWDGKNLIRWPDSYDKAATVEVERRGRRRPRLMMRLGDGRQIPLSA